LQNFSSGEIAIVASGRMTNEELWLTSRLARLLDVDLLEIVPRRGPGDEILVSEDRNPNTNGAKLILGLTNNEGEKLPAIVEGVTSGQIKALIALGENPVVFGLPPEQLSKLSTFVVMDILENAATKSATVVFPSFGFAEKRGSMINRTGRLQRLNRAVNGPGEARDDWEILRDLIHALSGQDGVYSIDDVFRQMGAAISQFSELSLSKIGDLGLQLLQMSPNPSPPARAADRT
jgi:NADH-quinone oxidoreductase subunit G